MVDTVVSSHFVSALYHEEVRRYVMLSHPRTLAEHVAAAAEAHTLPGLVQTKASTRRIAAVGGTRPRSRQGGNRDSEGPLDRNNRPVYCWICQGRHFQSDCPEFAQIRAHAAARAAPHGSENQ